jgi:hypothetical protein
MPDHHWLPAENDAKNRGFRNALLEASMSTGEVPVVKSKLPIRLTLRHATGEMPRSRRRNYRERYSSAGSPAPGILNRILFQLFVKGLFPVPRTTIERHVGDGEVMDDLDGLRVIHTSGL